MSRVLEELVYGQHAHSDPRTCVDVPFDVARRRPDGHSHTVWQVTWHMSYWMDYELHRIAGTPVPYPDHAALSWPDEAPPDAEGWRREQARFGEMLDRLAALAKAPPEERARTIPTTRSGEVAASLEDVVLQTVVHNSYHLGQVVALRRALGAWPPPSGSDTW